MKITGKELNERIGWTLPQKIDHSLYIIDAFLGRYPNCRISFSGGIDSTVMLHLIRIIDKNKKAIFINTTNEHSEILKFVQTVDNVETIRPKMTFTKVVEKYGFPLISKLTARMLTDLRNPHPNNEDTRHLFLTGIKRDGTKSNSFQLAKKYRYLINAPFDITFKCCNYLKMEPIKLFKKDGTFVGTMAIDSRQRRSSYLQTGCINLKQHKCIPLSIWTKEDIWNYIRQNNLSYCDVYDKGESHTGCAYCAFGIMFDPLRFQRLKNREPKRYEQMMKIENNGITYKEALETIHRGSLTKPML